MLRIIKTSSDGITGHISIDCHVEEKVGSSTFKGTIETHGIAPEKLQEQYNGSTTEWLRGIHAKMLRNHENRKKAVSAVSALQGQTLFNDEENDNHGNQSAPAGSKL